MKSDFSLKEYSLFAGIFVCNNLCNSQVIYTDIEPDVIVSELDQLIDLDNDGTDDFRFIKESLTNSVATLYNCYSSLIFEVGCINSSNSIVGNSIPGLKDIVYGLSSSSLINSGALFAGDIWQHLTYKVRDLSCLYHEPIGPWEYPNIGDWASHREMDQFIGVKFKNIEVNCFYYGWIRCQISDSLDELTIKDFAYNSNCGEGVLAGTLTSPITNTNPDVSVVLFENQLSINIPQEYINSDFNLYSINGVPIMTLKLENCSTRIDLNLLINGNYIIKINNRYCEYSEKIHIVK